MAGDQATGDDDKDDDMPTRNEDTIDGPGTATGRTATIVVCPLSKVAETAEQHAAGRVLSLIGDPDLCVTPDGVTDHLVVNVHDIVTANGSQILADISHVQQVIDFARGWDGSSPMLVHCFAGISRSTASAFIVACVLQPDRDEGEIAAEIRAASPTAFPNRHLVTLADQILGRDGRMVAAVERIGRGEPAEEGVPFAITLRIPADS
jgi:predicted protein tyrosine phosphatase